MPGQKQKRLTFPPGRRLKSRLLADCLFPYRGKALLVGSGGEFALERSVTKRHVSELSGVLERIFPLDFHCRQTVGLPPAVGWQISSLGTAYDLYLHAEFHTAAPAGLSSADVIFHVRRNNFGRQAEAGHFVKE